jgi:hypothetical protein
MNEQVKASEKMLSRGRRSNAFYFLCVWRRYISKLVLRIFFQGFEKYTRT